MTKFKILFGLLILLSIGYSCTPKVAAPIVEKPIVEEPKEEKEDTNPCITLDELSSSKRDEVETAYVLYKDQVKMKKFEAAFPLWEKAYYGAPAANGSIKYQYEDGIKIYRHFYENTNDAALKKTYLDSINSIYDKRVEWRL